MKFSDIGISAVSRWTEAVPYGSLFLSVALTAFAVAGIVSSPMDSISPYFASTHRFTNTQVASDGILALEGEHWNTGKASISIDKGRAFLLYDFGRPTTFYGVFIQADHNDTYAVDLSDNNLEYQRIFSASPVSKPGLRSRKGRFESPPVGRYVRVQFFGGDDIGAIAEFQIYQKKEFSWPSVAAHTASISVFFMKIASLLFAISLFGVALISVKTESIKGLPTGVPTGVPNRLAKRLFFLCIHPTVQWWAATVTAVACGGFFVYTWRLAYPFSPETIGFLRMISAVSAIGVALLLYLCTSPRRLFHRVSMGILAFWMLVAVGSYVSYGQPQFYDEIKGEGTFLHNVDMMVYFPLARFANELQFDGVYAAHTAAMVENVESQSLESIAAIPIRDLRTNALRPIGEMTDHIDGVRNRFSKQRWKAFKADSLYFYQSLGKELFLRNMRDHGGNATPVWLLLAHGIFRNQPAGDSLLFAGAMVDFVLLALLFVVMVRTFGIYAGLFCLLVWGANDFYMGGTCWSGATLRNDWMVAVGLGVCALKANRFVQGGALLMVGTLIRAFPGAAFVPMASSTVILLVLYLIKKAPKANGNFQWHAYFAEIRPVLATALGASMGMVFLVALAAIIYSPQIWMLWFKKVMLLNQESHINNVSLKVLFAYSHTGSEAFLQQVTSNNGWQQIAREVFATRQVWFTSTVVLITGMVIYVSWRRPLWQQALIGMLLIPVWTDPANYYHHIVFLLPLLAFDTYRATSLKMNPTDFQLLLSVLLLCVLQYGTIFRTHTDDHFLDASVLLLTCYGVILFLLFSPSRTAFAFDKC